MNDKEVISRIRDVARDVMTYREQMKTKKDTKNLSVLPFIEALGYNTRNPLQVRSAFSFDLRAQKGSQVDYVVLDKNQGPAVVIVVKKAGEELESRHLRQRFTWVGATGAYFAILTDGISYEFYNHYDTPNCIDQGPFANLRFDELDVDLVRQLFHLSRDGFDRKAMQDAAEELRFETELKASLTDLPRWALVALLARVARRATPLYYLIMKKSVKDLTEGVAWAWTMAAEATALFDYRELEHRVEEPTRSGFVGDWMAGHMLANGAKHVAECVVEMLQASYSQTPASEALRAILSARSAVSQAVLVTEQRGFSSNSSCRVNAQARSQFDCAITSDLQWLRAQAKEHEWTDESSVDPSALGPLWPAGAPKTWPPDPWDKAANIRPTVQQLAASRRSFQSCFISYSHADKDAATRLHSALEAGGIRCWLDEKEILPGDEIHEEIDRAIRTYDRVILCCSRSSLAESWWVDRELDRAFEKERRLLKDTGERFRTLIPVDLDGFVFTDECKYSKKSDILSRHVADFRAWQESNEFNEAVGQILLALHPERRDERRQ